MDPNDEPPPNSTPQLTHRAIPPVTQTREGDVNNSNPGSVASTPARSTLSNNTVHTGSIPSPFAVDFNSVCRSTFHVNPYPWQTGVGSKILQAHYEKKEIRTLMVRPTGGGKTLVFTSIAKCLGGVTICITPLLALGADQFRKFTTRTADNPTIAAIHLDEYTANMRSIYNFTKAYKAQESTLVIYSSAQCITENRIGFSIINDLRKRNLIRFVVVDEIHLFTEYGLTFRQEFVDLKRKFFSRFPKRVPMLFMTATCTESIKASFTKLTGIIINNEEWSTPRAMMHRSVHLDIKYTSQHFATLKKIIKPFLLPDPTLPNKCIVYTETRKKGTIMSERFSNFLDSDDDLNSIDSMVLQGDLAKEQKTKIIELFVNPEYDGGKKTPDVLFATSGVGNAGIDSPDVRCVFRLDFPASLVDICQERGRAGRRPNAHPANFKYVVCINLDSYLNIFRRIHNPDQPLLSPDYKEQQLANLAYAAKMMTSRYCYSLFLENAMGKQTSPMEALPACGLCANCTQKPIVPPIHAGGCSTLFFDILAAGQRTINELRTVDNVVCAVRSYPRVAFHLFKSNARSVAKIQVHKVILTLLGAGILELCWTPPSNITIHLAKSRTPNSNHFALQDIHMWMDINLKA